MSAPVQKQERIKLCVFGSGGVGKSALAIRFVQSKFVDEYDPSVTDCYRKDEKVDGRMVHLEVTDTAGQEEFSALRAVCYRKADGFLAVYSVLDRQSLAEVQQLKQEVLAERAESRVPMVVLANKCDVRQDVYKVNQREGKATAATWFEEEHPSVPFFETSALEDSNVTEAFHQVIREVRAHRRGEVPQAPQPKGTEKVVANPPRHPPPPRRKHRCTIL
eukprot:TRINITY_DN3755_c0_g1_i1.p1 TRINITY_DN3755_c0_g1~~TRINITY_DN3755_c0_g1_i1.p1  ORF type:complete len:219 (+),score=62.36 TRINITY_DN3755_c0_g1_i1:103-759(+)